MGIYKGRVPLSTCGERVKYDTHQLFEYKWFDHKINHLSWACADNFNWMDGTIFTHCYSELLSEYNNPSSVNKETLYKKNFSIRGGVQFSETGVASNFSASNTLSIPTLFTPSTNTWEINLKIKTGSSLATQQMLAIQKGLTNETRYGTRIGINDTNHFIFSVSYNGTAWDIVSGTTAGATGTYVALTDTEYYLKYQFTGEAYILSYSLDGETYTQDCYVASTTPMYNANQYFLLGSWNNGSYVDVFLGSIDLDNSYIKIGDNTWWKGYNKVVYKETPKGYRIALQDQLERVEEEFSLMGRAWYYILYPTNQIFKLPRDNSFIHGELIETFKDGYSWYKIYEDGWCEQGGDMSPTNVEVVPLYKKYKDTTYSVLAVNGNMDTGSRRWSSANINNESSIKLMSSSSSTAASTAPTIWETRGYLANDQYDHSKNPAKKYLYCYVGEFTQTSTEQIAGMNIETLSNKVNKSDCKQVYPVIEFYENGSSGYKIYSNGYCEQWGQVNYNVGTSGTITFIKPWRDTYYTITGGMNNNSSTAHFFVINTYNSKTTTTIGWYKDVTGVEGVWRACGYLPNGEY